MHRVDSRTYVGQPGEVVTLTTHESGGGQVMVLVDGQDIGTSRRFTLPTTAGSRTKFQVSLMGPLGASCVVGIAVVDGASDGDFLMCQAHNPAPVNFYTGSVVGAPALRALARVKGLPALAPAGSRKRGKAGKAGGKKQGGPK